MDKYTATEQAYKNGYEKGYEAGTKNAVLMCKDCRFCKLYETNQQYHCRSQMGLYRRVADYEFCSWGERKDNERKAD
jgi:hypothetical protein